MTTVTLGSKGITTNKNAFGALPIQRISDEDAIFLLRKAYEGGMAFFDTARAYTDSEKKVGMAFEGMRTKIYIATKTGIYLSKASASAASALRRVTFRFNLSVEVIGEYLILSHFLRFIL